MVCPYCNNHPLPNLPFCNHCGIIFKLNKRSQKPRQIKSARSSVPTIIALVIGALIGALIGFLVGKVRFDSDTTMMTAFAAAGLLIGALIGYLVVAGRVTFQRARLNAQRRRIHSEIAKIEKNRQEKLEQLLLPPDAPNSTTKQDRTVNLSVEQRMDMANELLITGQVDEAVQQLEQVYRQAKASSVDFLNNCGVAFARRGQLQVALDRFTQAADVGPDRVEPRINLLHSIAQTRDMNSVSYAISGQNGHLEAIQSTPRGVNHLSFVYAYGGDQKKATNVLEQAITINPKDADTRNDLGVIKAMEKHWRESLADFTLALQTDSGEACAAANIGLVLHNQGKVDEATQRFATAVKVDPHNARLHSLLGAAMCKMKLTNEGIREFRDARIHDASLYESNYNLGKVYIENGILDQAEHCLDRAFEINPYSWQTLVAMAVLNFKQNRIQQAIDSYKQAHLAHPDEPIVLGGLALCIALNGDYQQAGVLFERALENNLQDADLINNYAWFFLIQSDIEHANEQLESIINNLNKKHPHACANMGLCQHEMGALDTAQQYFKTALAGNADLSVVHYNLGCNYNDNKDVDNAIKSWELGKKAEAGNADLHTNLGVAYYKKDQFDKSISEFRRVLHLRQENAGDYANLGLALARMKRHKEAIEQFELGIELDEMNPMLHSNLGLACYFANRVEDAMREWGIVTRINKQYALMRAKKQQSEYDDTSMAYIPLFAQERAVYTAPKVPDYIMNFVPSYSATQLNLILDKPDLEKLSQLREQLARTDRRIRATLN
jgi:tetratricopeptide (TPR) repeat protein